MPARSVKNRKKSRKQRGGTKLTDAQVNILSGLGFTDEQKNAFNAIVEQTFNENVTAMLVTAAQNDIHRINPQTGRHFTPQELIDNLRNTVRNAAGVKRRRKSKKMRKSKKIRKNKKSKKMYMQRGGVFTEEEEDLLLNEGGFNQQQVDFLNQNNVSFQNIQTATNYVLDNNQHTIAVFIASCLQNENNQNIQDEMPQGLIIDDLQGEGEAEDNPALNEAFIQGNNNAGLNNSDATDPEQDSYSFGNDDDDDDIDFDLDLNDEEPNNNEIEGGRRRKGKKSRKTKKQRGGTVFSQEQLTELGRLGFNDQQKKILAREFSITPPNMAMESIRQALQHNHITGQPDTVESIMRMFPPEGGKRRKSRKSRKMKGGMRYGTGVGANCFDPNFSIYNTPTLSLFPYKPN